MIIMALPKANSGDIDGAYKVDGYIHVLRGMPLAQIDFMVDKVLRRTNDRGEQWLPGPGVCLEIAQQWTRTDEAVQARMIAARKARDERQTRLSEARNRLRSERCDQAWIDGLTDRASQILETEGLLHRCATCGSYSQRGQWRHWAASQADIGSIDELREQLASNFPNSPKREAMEA